MAGEIHLVLRCSHGDSEAIEAWMTKEEAEKRIADLDELRAEFLKALKIAGLSEYEAPQEWVDSYRARAHEPGFHPMYFYTYESVPLKGTPT